MGSEKFPYGEAVPDALEGFIMTRTCRKLVEPPLPDLRPVGQGARRAQERVAMPLVSGCTSAEKFSMQAVYGPVLTYFVSRFQKCTMSSLAVSSVESSRNLQAYT